MADSNVTESKITDNAVANDEATKPAAAAPSPAAMKAHAPSPAVLAKSPVAHPASSSSHDDVELKEAESFGRVDDNGTVYVKEGEGEREVGQFPDASADEALALYARRYLDLKAKLDVFANRLKSNSIKPREIDETLAALTEEVKQPAVVGNIPALQSQLEELRKKAAAKKEAIAKARKEAMAKAIAERTSIVEKAEALAAGLGDNTNWRSTADKFRSLFEQWQEHQRTTIRIDKSEADALWKRFSGARTTFNQARRKWAGPVTPSGPTPRRRRRRSSPKPTKSRIPQLGARPRASSTNSWTVGRRQAVPAVMRMMHCGRSSALLPIRSSMRVRPTVNRSAPTRRRIWRRRRRCW